ncbi:uncharacterized protein BXZ73DRAFT_52263 [Epithele typhae]|uniref:uncharacterized protein n=1 Tax=Epithele typhae TaxID=378194 RepID=UPI002007494F|nr:uncharacterized protein BXZ73DRAFT_52263 [Epithele typhae]KAH9920259.1 hypothetical protein BXZ73DRAFT_52263 [Epithele typhae]
MVKILISHSPLFSTNGHPNPSPILIKHNVPFCHWFERALQFHGSDTVALQYYLLVHSVSDAEAALLSAGWTHTVHPPSHVELWDPAVDGSPVVLVSPTPSDPPYDDLTILFDAGVWTGMSKELSTSPKGSDHYPSLSRFYCALVHRILDTSSESFIRYLRMQLHYLYAAQLSLLSSPASLESIDPELRQWHVDWIKGELNMPHPDTIAHERDIRERARRGDWVLLREGSDGRGGRKFNRELEARIRAKRAAARVSSEEAPCT